MDKKITLIIGGIFFLTAGAFLGLCGSRVFYSRLSLVPADINAPALFSVRADSADIALINPTVTSNLGKHFIINFKPLKEELLKIQENNPQKTYLYFSYLNNSSWIGLGERDLFVSASTIKVPLAMSVLKAVEESKLKLTDTYTLEDLDLDDRFGELYKVGSDKEFTVDDLIKIMLTQSDNTAMHALINILNKIGLNDPFVDVYKAMGWDIGDVDLMPEIGQAPNYQVINLKTLSSMFVALYDAKYINIEHSNKILQYLTGTPFGDKIVAGVPKDIVVSHKIGVSTVDKTYSDCGIVYAPNRHYLLCLGSNGGDEKKAAEFMAEASRAVYQFVINN